ncbi:MAG: Fic family protein [Bacilli bacterium]|jgi:Fic family protein
MKRSGTYVNNLLGDIGYRSFKPADLPPQPGVETNQEIDEMIKEAYRLLGRLDGASAFIPNRELFISMYVRKEALLSSQIEGTQATMEDIFDPRLKANLNRDVEDVTQYLKALSHANELIAKLPISVRFLKEMHNVLLTSQRGQDKEPGELRRTQNWIGAAGSTLQTARYIPPNIADMSQALASLEKFIHAEDELDPLIKIALIHYQFETIHPFLDGNGRVGRLLISLLLKQYRILSYDTLYLSFFLKKNRREYYERLDFVRTRDDYEGWVRFFVEGLIETADHALRCIDELLELRAMNAERIAEMSTKPRKTASSLFTYIEAHPIIDIKQTSIDLGKAFNTIAKAIATFVDLGILQKIGGGRRYRIYAYRDYLNILRDGTE